jgi:hypothetical protein
MWPLNLVPTEEIKTHYDITIDPQWIKEVQMSCLHINGEASGSFVSPSGLVMTNHHVASKAIYNLSSKERNLLEQGYYASSQNEELKCAEMFMDQLMEIRDVTKEISEAAPLNASPTDRESARRAVMAKLKEQAQAETGLQPEIVPLYRGAKYNLYLYKRYTDIRLVMAPQKTVAFFGGDEDNFEFPRYNFDVCFLRIYENNAPLLSRHHFTWNPDGPHETEALFVAGHPGRTQRIYTSDHFKFLKDYDTAIWVKFFNERVALLQKFQGVSEENQLMALQDLYRYSNAQKLYSQLLATLNAGEVIAAKELYERQFFERVGKEKQKPWRELSAALQGYSTYYPSYFVLEGNGSQYSTLYTWAKQLVRLSDERGKPNEQRLEEYIDSELPALEQALFAPSPFYKELDLALFTDGIGRLVRMLGTDSPAVKAAVHGKAIEQLAKDLTFGSKLADPTYRRLLFDHPEEVKKSTDPMILFARTLDPYARALRKRQRTEFAGVEQQSYAAIAQLAFAEFGTKIYPDATGTLRLSTGTLKGYVQDGRAIAPMTTLSGLFAHAKEHNFKSPFALPSNWTAEALEKNTTPINFASTNDMTAGNSGSPIFNERREIVGLIFDKNRQAIPWDLRFDEVQGRGVAVHSTGIIEMLSKIYRTDPLIQELQSP